MCPFQKITKSSKSLHPSVCTVLRVFLKPCKKLELQIEKVDNLFWGQAYPTKHGRYSLSPPPPGLNSPLHHWPYSQAPLSLLIGVVFLYKQTCGGQLPTLVMMACQHPWAQCGRKSTVLDEDLLQTSHLQYIPMSVANNTDCTTNPAYVSKMLLKFTVNECVRCH